MSNGGDNADESFASRWSRRKTALRDGEDVTPEQAPAENPVAVSQEQADDGRDLPIPDDLPDIDSLEKDSDYSLFMRDSTPEYLKRLALRKLWSSDPTFAVLDGLNDYDEDFSKIGMIVEEVTTRYQAGKGMVEPDEKKEIENPEEKTGDQDVPEEIAEDVKDVKNMEDINDIDDVEELAKEDIDIEVDT
ncbi:MAG: hypothetical protein CMJ96_07240 [Planctomycetes bacterium]|nr:hypothetical protein [Planctomycetota bacterium]